MIFTAVLSMSFLGQIVLPGSDLSVEHSQEKSHIILVGGPTKFSVIMGVGAVTFTSIDLKHSIVLKGNVQGDELKQLGLAASGHEVLPEKGEEYLIFIKKWPEGQRSIIKMLPNTRENLEAVKKEIITRNKP